MWKQYPPPIKAVVEGLFVIAVLVIVACSYYGIFDFFNVHPVLILVIFCAAVLLWYKSKD